MTTQTDSKHYEMGVHLAEIGKYQEALDCIQEHLRASPSDPQAINDAGVILHCLGRDNEAVKQLTRARSLDNENAEIVWNLVEAYLAAGRAHDAAMLFDDMERLEILNPEAANRTATLLLDQNNKADAVEVLLRSFKLWPQQEVLRPILDLIRTSRPKIAFLSRGIGAVGLFEEIYEFAAQRFEVQHYNGVDMERVRQLMEHSDICWSDGCDSMTVEVSKLPKVCKSVVCLHRLEIDAELLSRVQWENVDMLVVVGGNCAERTMLNLAPDIHNRARLVTIPDAANLDRFKFIDRQRGKNLACMGRLDITNNPMFLLQCMQKLHYIDCGYKLFFGGTYQSAVLEQNMKHIVAAMEMRDAVFFDGQQKDLNCWLQDKHYVVSTAVGPGQTSNVLEAMACGLKPVVHNFTGAGEIFPQEFLFNISEQFCEQVLCDRYEPARYRRFVEENYPLVRQLEKVNQILAQLEAEIDLQRTASAPCDGSSRCEQEPKKGEGNLSDVMPQDQPVV